MSTSENARPSFPSYPYEEEPARAYYPEPEPKPKLPEVPLAAAAVTPEARSSSGSEGRGLVLAIGGGALVTFGLMGAMMISSSNSLYERQQAFYAEIPSLVQADGFVGADKSQRADSENESAERPVINLQATPDCKLENVRVIAVNEQGNVTWVNDAVDILQYTMIPRSVTGAEKGPVVTETFRDYAEFASSGLKAKYCS